MIDLAGVSSAGGGFKRRKAGRRRRFTLALQRIYQFVLFLALVWE